MRGRISSSSWLASSTEKMTSFMSVGVTLGRALLRFERIAAPAGAHGIRIVEGESAALEVLDVVDLDAVQDRRARGVDQHLHAAELAHPVSVLDLRGQRHAVRVARAPALLDEHAQPDDGVGV